MMNCHYEKNCLICTEKINLFSNLPEEIQTMLAEKSIYRDVKPGESVFREGEAPKAIYVLLEGKLKLHKTDSEGQETIFDILEKGDVVGEEYFLEDSNYPFDATALVSSRICILRNSDFVALVNRDTNVTLNLIDSLSRKLKQANEKSAILSENNAKLRLLSFLHARSRRVQGGIVELTVDEIAASINLRRETVSRKISELQKENLVRRIGPSALKVLDPEGVRAILPEADGDD